MTYTVPSNPSPTTIEVLERLLREGLTIRSKLRSEYFHQRNRLEFKPDTFLRPFEREIGSWIGAVEQVLDRGFASSVAAVAFQTAPVSPLRQDGTNMRWGNLLAALEAKLGALTQIVRDADPRSIVPLQNQNAVFLVHGRDQVWNDAVGSFLARYLSVIVLEDQANLGATLIEKFEANADVGAAVVLFTPDDVGCLRNEQKTIGLVPRARQNVLIELGFFFGRLGRERVCLLREPSVEVPSDLSGIVYTQIEITAQSRWQDQLLRELGAMGLTVA